MNTPYIFFDVANTLLEKRELYEVMLSVLKPDGFKGSLHDIQKTHRLVSEKTKFPPKTDDTFYRTFNTRFVRALGMQISDGLLHRISAACRDLPWRAYPDVVCLKDIPYPKGIISNWDTTLPEKVHDLLPYTFFPIIGSAVVGVSKPDKKIFQIALQEANVAPAQCWYIGDSLIQDMEPATRIGMHVILIDRYAVHPEYTGVRIQSLLELPKVLKP